MGGFEGSYGVQEGGYLIGVEGEVWLFGADPGVIGLGQVNGFTVIFPAEGGDSIGCCLVYINSGGFVSSGLLFFGFFVIEFEAEEGCDQEN